MVNIGPLDLAMSLGLGSLVRTDVPEVQTRFDLLLKKTAEKGIHVLCPALPTTLEQARKLAAAGRQSHPPAQRPDLRQDDLQAVHRRHRRADPGR